MSQRYPRIGEQITRLTRTLVAVQGWDKAFTMDYVGKQTGYSPDMVYRWQQGRSCPSSQIVEILTRIGKEEASLPRDWGESLLKATRHPDAASIVNDLWGSRTVHSIPCNLPPSMHVELIGRQAEITRLLKLLSPRYAAHLITVDGIGGVGKTALVLEVAYHCWRASTGEAHDPNIPTFEAIIFFSAKQQYLTPDGILPRYEAQRTLRDLFRKIAHTLNPLEITQSVSQDQLSMMRDALAHQRTLLIVDNLETIEDKQEILSFLFELPPPIKIVITTRERALSFSPMHLKQLAEEEALYLIEKQAQEKEAQVSKDQALVLYQHIGGIPAALTYAIGQIANGYSVKTVLERVSKVSGDVARFCFEGSVGLLRGQHAHALLIALAMFSKPPLRVALALTAGLASDPIGVEEGLAQLKRLSLVSQEEDRYGMLPLTREYALAELAGYPEFEQAARERWVTWYLNFVKEYGGKDWTEWHIQFDRIEEEWENLLAVFDWCAAHNQYHTIRAFWLVGGVNRVAGIYGYWDDHLTWHDWLIQAAEKYADWPTAVEAMIDKGFTLILMGQLEETEDLLRRARDYQEFADHRVQGKLAENIARLRIYQKQYEDACNWLDQAEALFKKTILDESESTRRQITIQNYRGRICYEIQDYSQAKFYFREALEHAQSIGFQRGLIYAQKYLADIATAEGRFDEAASLLQTGLITAERNNDKRRAALYKKSFAHLHKKQGRLDEARHWAREALGSFERLGMQLEAKEIHALLQELQG